MPNYISHLGHQAHLSIAEIESVFHPSYMERVAREFVVFTAECGDDEVRARFVQLGGSRSIHRVVRADVPKKQLKEELISLME